MPFTHTRWPMLSAFTSRIATGFWVVAALKYTSLSTDRIHTQFQELHDIFLDFRQKAHTHTKNQKTTTFHDLEIFTSNSIILHDFMACRNPGFFTTALSVFHHTKYSGRISLEISRQSVFRRTSLKLSRQSGFSRQLEKHVFSITLSTNTNCSHLSTIKATMIRITHNLLISSEGNLLWGSRVISCPSGCILRSTNSRCSMYTSSVSLNAICQHRHWIDKTITR